MSNRKSCKQLNLILKQVAQDQGEEVKLNDLEIVDVVDGAFKKQRFPIELVLEELKEIKTLKKLNLANLSIKRLPSEIGALTNLEYLNLSGNYLSELPLEIRSLVNLESLNISNNKLRDLPVEICSLTKLNTLNLNDNQLNGLPNQIGQLGNLAILYLKNNPLKALPTEIRLLKNLVVMDLHDTDIPIPIEMKYKLADVQEKLEYYFSLNSTSRALNESKLIVVGQPAVGKTSLVRRIIENIYIPHKTKKTEGISINQWKVDSTQIWAIKNKGQKTDKSAELEHIQLNIWDFGGQDIMHATHQFFLTKRSLYLLVLDSHLTQEENRVEYWLKIIQSFGGESPVLIVGNKIGQQPLDIDRTGLQKKYPNIVGILETSAATGASIEELKAAITEQVNNLPHVRDLLPETWFTVKTKLEALGRESNFITYDKYFDLCNENDIRDETSQRTLIGFLHDLGVVLYFQEDYRLAELGILNPQWVTNGVYKIINSHTLFQNKGVLTLSMLNDILDLPKYPRGKRLFIVDMMKKFELCYDIEADKTFLVPDLLPKDEPIELKFAGIPAFEYVYPVLPFSVFTRLIVRMNQHVDNNCVWRTGVVLKIGDNRALVKADIEDRKITIAIDGIEHTRRDALAAIRYQLDEIHNSIKGLNPEKRVPIPEAPNAEPLEYNYLLMLEREGQETHLVKDGTRLVKVNVREILSAIESESQRRETGGSVTNIYIGGDVKGSTIISGNKNIVLTQKIQDSFNKTESANIQVELKEALKQLAEAVNVMNKSLPKEQAAEVADDFGKLVDEATKPSPNKRWYSVSIEGLIKAAQNLDQLGEPVISLSRKVLSLLTGGLVNS